MVQHSVQLLGQIWMQFNTFASDGFFFGFEKLIQQIGIQSSVLRGAPEDFLKFFAATILCSFN